jgi:alpha-glucosidase
MPEITGSLRRSLFRARLAARELVALSPTTMRAIAANSLRMQRQDRRDRAVDRSPAIAVTAGAFLSGVALTRRSSTVGITAIFERATLELECFSDDVLRISWGPDDEPVPWATEPDFELPELGEVDVTSSEHTVVARTASLRIEVSSEGVRVFDGAGMLRYHELAPLRRGAARVQRRLLRSDEQLFGFGEQSGSMDHRGRSLRLWNRDPGGVWGSRHESLYCSMPVSFGRHRDGPVLVFTENSFDASVRVDPPGEGASELEIRFVGGMVRSWVIVGDDATLMRRYAGITGKPPLPPRWALGYHHSRWGFSSTEELREVLDGFAGRGLPISAMHLDIDHMDRFRSFVLDEQRFGDVDELAAQAGGRGTRLVAVVDPAIARHPDDELFEAARAGDHLVRNEDGTVHVGTSWPGWSVFPDFTRAKTRSWWSSLYPRLLDRGISGIWHDMNEPTSITLGGDHTLPRSARHDNNGRGGDHREAHNVYGMLMNRAAKESLRAHRPERRPFVVSRSGWAGMQRHAWIWTGDVESTPAGLTQQLSTFLGLSLSGVSMVGSDVGGFSGAPSPTLYTRWMELGVVSPFFRTHSVLGAAPREPWRWPMRTTEQVAALIALRYRLLPYLYSVVEAMSVDGSPYFRPLWWGDRHALESVSSCEDAVFVGPSLLFALSGDHRRGSRKLTLPRGSWWRWFAVPGPSANADDAERFTGNESYEFSSPLGQPLLFVRGGSIIPLDDAWRYPSRPAGGLRVDHAPQRLAFHIFPDQEGQARGTHYDDGGDGDGESRSDSVSLEGDVVTWTSQGDRLRPASIELVIHGRLLRGAIADGIPVPPGALTTDGSSTTVRVDAFKRLKLS